MPELFQMAIADLIRTPQQRRPGVGLFVIDGHAPQRRSPVAIKSKSTRASADIEASPLRCKEKPKTIASKSNTVLRAHMMEALSLTKALDSFAGLKKGWNSYSAPPPTSLAILNSKLMVMACLRMKLLPSRVEPSVVGGAGIVFFHGSKEVVVEFYNGGRASALFADEAVDSIETEAVTTDSAGYETLSTHIKAFLNGQETG